MNAGYILGEAWSLADKRNEKVLCQAESSITHSGLPKCWRYGGAAVIPPEPG